MHVLEGQALFRDKDTHEAGAESPTDGSEGGEALVARPTNSSSEHRVECDGGILPLNSLTQMKQQKYPIEMATGVSV